MRKLMLLVALLAVCQVAIFAQTKGKVKKVEKPKCDLAISTIDEFDSTRLVVAKPINIGYRIASQFETENGPLMIEEGKVLFSYTENDSINCFFITLAMAERNYLSIDEGENVLIKLSDGRVLALYNIPDKGEFNKKTNMRIYQHTCVVPLDLFYSLTYNTIEAIRIEYKGYKKTLEILPEQQKAILEAARCVGEASKLYPVKP